MNDNRIFFRDTVERILADMLTQKDIEAAEQRILPAKLYQALSENGIMLMLVPEDAGGIGANVGDAVAILRAAGAASAPGPLAETMLGQALLARAGLPTTGGTIALAFSEAASEGAPVTVFDVLWGGLADHVLVISPAGSSADITLVASDNWSVERGLDTADEPRDTLSMVAFSGTRGIVAEPIADILKIAAILRGGQILGGIEWTLARSIDYAGERKQFGREISKFQVVQQMLAELADHSLASSGITEAAAESLSTTLVAAARSRLGDASDAAIGIGHQVHGALGFSREYALNLRTRRLMAWRDDYGSVQYWRRTLASSFLNCTRETFWPAVADAGPKPVE